jgi:hypothetical protein
MFNIKSLVLQIVENHQHARQKVAPLGAAGIALVSGAGAWNLGNFSNDIIAAGAETEPFDLHGVDIEAPSANASYEIVFYFGAADTECGRATFTRTNPTTVSRSTTLMTHILPAGSRVRAKMRDSTGASSCTVKVWYHDY